MGGVRVLAGEKEEGGYRFGVRGNWVMGHFPAWAEALPRGRFHFFVSSFLLFLFCFLFDSFIRFDFDTKRVQTDFKKILKLKRTFQNSKEALSVIKYNFPQTL
jgi:hypothetical protein